MTQMTYEMLIEGQGDPLAEDETHYNWTAIRYYAKKYGIDKVVELGLTRSEYEQA